jgi:hypothetical protein
MNQALGIKGGKSYLLWEGIPFLLPLFVFGFISALNWDYESKLISPDNGSSDWTGVHMGLIFLAMTMVFALIASVLLFLVRVIAVRIASPNLSMTFTFVSLIAISILFIFPSLFMVILGPSNITMMEQMRAAPR